MLSLPVNYMLKDMIRDIDTQLGEEIHGVNL